VSKKKSQFYLYRFTKGDLLIHIILFLTALICVLPVWNVICISFSRSAAVNAGYVSLWPVHFTTSSYHNLMEDSTFFNAFGVSVLRVILGTSMSMILMFLMSYPLSMETDEFPMRTVYMWFIVFTMLFNGGLIPTYMVVTKLGMRNTIWALTVPGAVSTYNTILMINCFRNLPKELRESASMDGATPMRTLIQIYIPVSIPTISTLTLFCALWHWNDYFQGMIYMQKRESYPLMTYIRSLTFDIANLSGLTAEEMQRRAEMGSTTFNAAKVTIAMIPVLCVYPFVQKYFVRGIMLGSVKG
jgi:putative aldouronate transport system permease protein